MRVILSVSWMDEDEKFWEILIIMLILSISVAYWARVYSLQNAIKLAKQPDEKQFLLQLMDWLENVKKANKDNDLISIDTVAQAHL